MLYDFHTHTYLSDGVLSPVELIRRAMANGYTALGIADHCAQGGMRRIIEEVGGDCRLARERWDFPAVVGVEITHVPASAIPQLAAEARKLGAELVVVHGETLVEPVEPGTNLAAVSCPQVDILAHPGLLTEQEAQLAAENGVFVELTTRQGHCLSNGLVAQQALAAGAQLVLNSDTHQPSDLLTEHFAEQVVRAAGVPAEKIREVLIDNPQQLLRRAEGRRASIPEAGSPQTDEVNV